MILSSDLMIGIIAAIILIAIVVLQFRHLPKYRLNQIQIERIKEHGLMHFTLRGNIDAILKEGIKPGKKKPMNFLEKDMVWTYIADPACFPEKLNEIHSKGERSAYDAVIYIKDIPENEFKNFKYRPHPEAIVHLGVLITDNMTADEI